MPLQPDCFAGNLTILNFDGSRECGEHDDARGNQPNSRQCRAVKSLPIDDPSEQRYRSQADPGPDAVDNCDV